jgi:hypothetical protein
MKRLKALTAVMAAVFAFSSAISADDGEITNKRLSDEKDVPAFSGEVSAHVPEAEHAFTGMMGFYVPMQASSGATLGALPEVGKDDPRDYYNIDGNLVETLDVAKPLINVFIYGPALEVHGTAFAHSYMDTYGAVSLDDGQTFKETNLSDSAVESSFDLETDRVPSAKDPLPADHDILLGSINNGGWHAAGYTYPFTSHCTECHGPALQGTAQAPSCYSCHDSNKWDEATPVDLGPVIKEAIWKNQKLVGEGENALAQDAVTIVNGENGDEIVTVTATLTGTFVFNTQPAAVAEGVLPPCTVAGRSGDLTGPSLRVLDKFGEPVENCVGYADDLVAYPGGTYNVVHAVAGNKVLVAWPSRFCSQGQPAYSFAWDGDDSDLNEDNATELIAKREAVTTLLGIDVTTDLYLTDLFGVAGKQGSIDFADEGYPQAGVVPFGCVWTARGVLLPGDDPRTIDVTEESYMAWTKAERLTSGRRDPNRIEVAGQVGAGFVITWQEDPDGLRPGQGEGPGEGWSGAVAHDKTDIWYSFIPWEHFDLVENPDEVTGEPVLIEDHDLLLTGRPQVYVPMAVPMRISNNDKCQAEEYGPGMTPSDSKYFSYCNYEVAQNYGLQDFCADTVDVPQGPQGELKPICVNAAGLPNIANTASTRPRTALQGYDIDGDGLFDSGWVIVAAEESKGLGRYTFLPDGTACTELERKDENYNPDCVSDIGKNQWYFSFDMGRPATSAEGYAADPDGLVQNLVSQGNLLNQPEVDWRTGEFYPTVNTVDMWDYGSYNFDLYNTEIARRSSLLVQPIAKAMNSANKLLVMSTWKQGTMRQGGPADVMARRILLVEDEGGEQCTTNYEWCTTDYEQCRTTYEELVITEECHTEPVKVYYPANPDYAYNAGQCKQDPLPLRCYPYLDLNGEGTFDEFTYVDKEVCENVETWEPVEICDVGDTENCRAETLCEDVPYCDVSEPGCTATESCEAAQSCDGVPEGTECRTEEICTGGYTGNPYSFANMACNQWILQDGSNPYYPDGICMQPAINLSGVIPDTCMDDDTDSATDCPMVDFTVGNYGIGDTNPILQGYIQGEGNTTRVLTWHQCPSDGVAMTDHSDMTPVTCANDYRTDPYVNLRDQSWYNPLDVAKGHRGFIDGDFVMYLYAWSPTWRLNAKGSDRYDLYVRRSFDGGVTWATTPGSFTASDGNTYSGNGTVTCETYRTDLTQTSGDRDDPGVCYTFGAGEAEHARNITQHKSMKTTTLDPRFAPTLTPTWSGIAEGCLEKLGLVDTGLWSCDDLSALMDSDLRDPSRFFMVFEVGDNTTTALGEAEPLDLFYSRGENFGDDFVVWTETDTSYVDPATVCYPTVPYDVLLTDDVRIGSGFCNEFENMNTRGDTHSSEASLVANPDGSKMYGVWAQWVFEDDEDYESDIIESDAMARRLWWIDDYISEDCSYSLPGVSLPDSCKAGSDAE